MRHSLYQFIQHSVRWLILIFGLSSAISSSTSNAQDAQVPPPVIDFLIDISGSMKDQISLAKQPILSKTSKLAEVKNRLIKLVSELPDDHRVIVCVFDHQRREVCDVILRSSRERDKLIEAITSIESRDGSTFLWRSVDEELRRVSELVCSTSQRARLVIYSDGDDMEKNANFTHKSVLDNHRHLIQTSLKLDWVTLGYDLAPPIKSDFENVGANVVRAISAEQLIPLRSGFDVSHTTIDSGQSILISDLSTGLQIAKQRIDFGDGTPSQDLTLIGGHFQEVRHVYKRAGTYEIKLSTETAHGDQDSSRRTITVKNRAWLMPVIRADIKVPQVERPLRLFVDQIADDLVLDWRFSDGTKGRGSSIAWTPKMPGKYSVELMATDQAGETKKQSRSFTVPNPVFPDVSIVLHRPSVEVGEVVTVSAEPINTALQYTWKAGPGNSSSGPTTTMSFEQPGRHEIRLTVNDAYGQSGTAASVVTVNLPSPPKARFQIAKNRFEFGHRITAKNESSPTACEFAWVLNGIPVSQNRDLECEPPEPGNYKIELQVKDRFGQIDTCVESIEVLRKYTKPVAVFRTEYERLDGGLVARFINESVGDVFTCEFDPGDGSATQLCQGRQDFKHTYGPGVWHPSVTIHGPKEAHFSAEIWKGEPVSVARPLPSWVADLAWQLPTAAAFAFCGLAAARMLWRRRVHRESMRLRGHMTIRPIDDPLTVYDFDLDEPVSEAHLSLPDETVLRIKNLASDYSDKGEFEPIEYEVEIERPHQVSKINGRLREDEESEIGDYSLIFSR